MKLEDLLPMSRSEFFDRCFRIRPVHIPGAWHQKLGRDRFGWATASRLLGMYRLIAPGVVDVGIMRDKARDVRLVLDKRSDLTFTFNDTTVQSRVSSHYYDPESLAAVMRQGAAVVINDAQVLDEHVREVGIAVEDFANARAFCNLYLNTPKEGLCQAHVDAHDLFVFHVEGASKVWRFHEFFKPDIDHNINPVQHPDFQPGKIVIEVELAPGDVLYVPWGLAHSVVTSQPSMHLSFGFTPPLRDRPNGARIPRYRFDLPRELE
jgi:hypothetical protein